jgi:hypothetical protein
LVSFFHYSTENGANIAPEACGCRLRKYSGARRLFLVQFHLLTFPHNRRAENPEQTRSLSARIDDVAEEKFIEAAPVVAMPTPRSARRA